MASTRIRKVKRMETGSTPLTQGQEERKGRGSPEDPGDKTLSGIIPVLPTPFNEDGSLDLESLNRLVDHAFTWGAHGIAIHGVASEVEKLTPEEYEKIADQVAQRIAGRLPLVMGVSGTDPGTAVRFSTHARRLGAVAVFAKAPPPSRPEMAEREAVDYYVSIAEAADLPVAVQNFALAAGGSGVLTLESMVRVVAADARIQYVKEETPPPAGNGKITQIRNALGERVSILSGLGGVTLVDDLRRGATGNMPGSVLVRPLIRIYDLYQQGREAEADELHGRILPLIVFRARWGNATVTKTILKDLGILKTAAVRPPAGGTLDEQALQELRRFEKALTGQL